MLRDLIRAAMKRKKATDPAWSMRRASLEAGQSESYVRDILDGSVRDPGIAGIMGLADVLGIARSELLDAVASDLGIGKRRSRAAAERILSSMSPAELAAFISSHKDRSQ